jgi:hypothetical protein
MRDVNIPRTNDRRPDDPHSDDSLLDEPGSHERLSNDRPGNDRPGDDRRRDDRQPAETLQAAFAATDYLVETEAGTIRVRIGRRHPSLDDRLGRLPWAIVTAFNPGARRWPASDNRGADAALKRRLAAGAPTVLLRTRHRDPDREWPDEAGWLFAPADAVDAERLGREFGQVAVVHGRADAPAALRTCGHAARSPSSP